MNRILFSLRLKNGRTRLSDLLESLPQGGVNNLLVDVENVYSKQTEKDHFEMVEAANRFLVRHFVFLYYIHFVFGQNLQHKDAIVQMKVVAPYDQNANSDRSK